jgi:hypothetical protein
VVARRAQHYPCADILTVDILAPNILTPNILAKVSERLGSSGVSSASAEEPMAKHIFKIGLVLGLFWAYGAAAQQDNRPANDEPKPLARDQSNAPDTAKKRQPDTRRNDLSRDPDRSTIGPRTTQGLAQDAISRSNSR